MTWTKKKLEKIPQIYRDALLALEPVISSRESLLRINAIHGGRLLTGLQEQYGYRREGLKTLMHNLEKQGLIYIDEKLGFVAPTAAGEALILALRGQQEKVSQEIPPFPIFQE